MLTHFRMQFVSSTSVQFTLVRTNLKLLRPDISFNFFLNFYLLFF